MAAPAVTPILATQARAVTVIQAIKQVIKAPGVIVIQEIGAPEVIVTQAMEAPKAKAMGNIKPIPVCEEVLC